MIPTTDHKSLLLAAFLIAATSPDSIVTTVAAMNSVRGLAPISNGTKPMGSGTVSMVYEGCLKDPSTNYVKMSEVGLPQDQPGPERKLAWTFNGGLSFATLNYNNVLDLESEQTAANPPTTWAVIQAQNGFSTASIKLDVNGTLDTYNEVNGPYYKYFAQVEPNQQQVGSDMTALTFLYPYQFNESSETNVPVPGTEINTLSFLHGSEAGGLWLSTINLTTGEVGSAQKQYTFSGEDSAISDIMYMPQQYPKVLVTTFYGDIHEFYVDFNVDTWQVSGIKPTGYIFENFGGSGRYMAIQNTGFYLGNHYSGYVYIYSCGLQQQDMVVLKYQPLPSQDQGSLEIVNSIPYTGYCYQSTPTYYGLYFLTNGNLLGYIPWVNGIGNYNDSMTSYLVHSFGNDTVTSTTFSHNPNKVVSSYNPITDEFNSEFVGGALFAGVIPSNLNDDFISDDGKINAAALSDVYIHDPCIGKTTKWVEQLIQGPAYKMVADANMNLLVQNGNNGLTLMSVPYLSNLPTFAAWVLNNAYQCSSGSNFWGKIAVAFSAAAFGFAIVTMLAEDAPAEALLFSIIEAGLAGNGAVMGATALGDGK